MAVFRQGEVIVISQLPYCVSSFGFTITISLCSLLTKPIAKWVSEKKWRGMKQVEAATDPAVTVMYCTVLLCHTAIGRVLVQWWCATVWQGFHAQAPSRLIRNDSCES